MIQVKDPLVLFKGDCKSCHVDRGVGKFGEELFIADCGMCHGLQAEGGVAPSLIGFDMSDESQKAYARDVIANGAAMNPTMPPFGKAKGGPLSDEQIDSLVNYLGYLSSQAKKEAK
jgi:mono/diheme cytochrome c family protein